MKRSRSLCVANLALYWTLYFAYEVEVTPLTDSRSVKRTMCIFRCKPPIGFAVKKIRLLSVVRVEVRRFRKCSVHSGKPAGYGLSRG